MLRPSSLLMAMYALAFLQTGAVADEDVETDDGLRMAPHWRNVVEHRTRGVRYDERDAYFAVLRVASELPAKTLKQEADAFLRRRRDEHAKAGPDPQPPFNDFVDLFRNPDSYTGRPVSFYGHVRKVMTYPAGKNSVGLSELHELWVFPEDSLHNPAVFVTTDLPDGLEEALAADGVVDHVRITGFFFKMYVYNSANGEGRIAPLLLAKRAVWVPPAVVDAPRWEWPAGIAAAAIAVITCVWLIKQGHRATPLRKSPASEDAPEFLASLEVEDASANLSGDASATELSGDSDEPSRQSR